MSGVRSLRRGPTLVGNAAGTSAPIYVDSDDNIVKVVPAGSGTTEVQIIDASSVQTLTNKTLTSPTINGAIGTAPAAVVIATKVVAASESGSTFFLNAAVEFASTLPTPALGLRFKFVVTAAPSGASYTIAAASALIHGFVVSKDLNAGTDGGATAGTPVQTITLVDGKSQIGDTVEISCDGTNYFALCLTGGNFDAITLS